LTSLLMRNARSDRGTNAPDTTAATADASMVALRIERLSAWYGSAQAIAEIEESAR